MTCALTGLALAAPAWASGLPPDLNPGADRTVDEDSPVTFTGAASDPEGDTVSLSWEFPGAIIMDGAEVEFTFAEPGDYDVRLWGNDGSNNVSDGVAVTVRDITAPTAVITGGSAQDAIEDESVTLEGTSSQDNVDVVAWVWDVEDTDGAHALTGDTVSYTWATPGTFVVTLSARDAAGNVGTAEVTFTVADVTDPVAGFTVTSPCLEDLPCTLDAGASTDNVAVVDWTWAIEDADGTVAAYTETVDFTWARPGDYRVTLTVADAAGNSATTASTVTVLDVTPPVAAFELASPFGNVEQTLDGSDSSDNVGIVSWQWSLEDIGSTATLTGQIALYTWLGPGHFDITLTVADAAGNTDSAVVSVVVLDTTAPSAAAGDDRTADEDTTVSFSASATTDNDPLFPAGATFTWTFTDGTAQTLTGQSASYTFATPGVFSVTLTVVDSAGNSATDGLVLTIIDVTPPVATFTLPVTVTNDAQWLDGTGSSDNVGITSWFWAIQDHAGTTTSTESALSFTWPVPGTYVVTLTVGDAAGFFASTSAYAAVADTTPPTASAGADRTVYEGVELAFDGGATDNDPAFPTGATFTWTFDEGGAKTLTGTSPTYTFTVPGVYLVTLTATDAAGNAGTDSMEVTVREHTPPTASFTLPSTVGNDAQALDGTASSDNVGVVSWIWTVEDTAGAVTLSGDVVSYTWVTPGTYNVTLTVADAAANTGSLTLSAVVTDTTAPTLDLADLATDEDAAFTFDARATTDNDPTFPGSATFVWNFNDGTAQELTGVQVDYTFVTPGNYLVTLTVTDAADNWASGQFTVTVRDVTAPQASFSLAASVDEDAVVGLDGSGSTDNVGIVDFTWRLEDTAGTVERPGAVANYTWVTPGLYRVTLVLSDAAGNVGTKVLQILVRDITAPVAAIEFAAFADEDVLQTFDGSGSTDNVGVVTYEWTCADVGGDQPHVGATATHTWTTPGSYRVTLRVIDAAGNENTLVVTVTVRDLTAPAVVATVPASWPEDSAVTFDAAATGDNDPNFPLGASFTWTFLDVTPFALAGASVSHVFANPGTYTIALAVADAAGNTATRQFELEVTDITAPLAAMVGPSEFDEDTAQAFAATGSSDNVGVVQFEWEFEDVVGAAVRSGAQVDYTWATPGTYGVTLTVRDGAGNTDFVARQVTVRDVTAPVAAFDLPSEVDEDTLVTFDDVGSSDNVAIVDWRWELAGQGSPVVLTGDLASYTFETPGVYGVVLTVTDAAGNSASASKSVFARDVTAPEVVTWVPATSPEDAEVELAAVSATDNVGVVGWVWTVAGVDGPVTLTGIVVHYTWDTPGTYSIRLEVSDAAGNVWRGDYVLEVTDATAPWLTVDSPADQALVATPTVELTGRLEPGATLRVNGADVAAPGGTFHAVVAVNEGSNVIELVATDAAGNPFSVHLVLVRDSTLPTLAVTEPAQSLVTREARVWLAGTVSDPHFHRLRVNGGAVEVKAGGAFGVYVGLAEGKNTIEVSALDTAGNLRVQEVVVWRDSTAPVVNATVEDVILEGARMTTTASTVTLSGTVEGGALVQLCSGPDAASLQCVPVAVEADGSWSSSVNLPADRVTTIEVRVTDEAGNAGWQQYTVQRVSPAAPADTTWVWAAAAAAGAAAVLVAGLLWSRRRGAA